MEISGTTLHGGALLTLDIARGVTTAVERLHGTIARQASGGLLAASGRSAGPVAGLVYRTIRGSTNGLRFALDQLGSQFASGEEPRDRELPAIAALNGVCGDFLAASGNPLALPMSFQAAHQDAIASGDIVVMVHGLGLSERNWLDESGLGGRLRSDLGATPIYLRYNTGRHISTNGREFSRMLEELCAGWPVPVNSLTLVGHSMGGLVIRSACRYAQRENRRWLEQLRGVTCLGSPHHGAPLEKAGAALDRVLLTLPYTAPLAFGARRSAGVKDLEYGNLLDEDWQGLRHDAPSADRRENVPLVPGVEYLFIAASVGKHSRDPMGHLFGDLLVRLDSASGEHRDPQRRLPVEPRCLRVFHEKNHFDLLRDTRVHECIVEWLRQHLSPRHG
ncbi:alpha/beta fold hydrolase [Mangrovimicrobium sediminis]|uniref:Alpha/beta fold hydrolase n=1 Tax=Mangrovimicrobium sediminis TaxID=2562682 RepID=A0A4Z0M6G9_9GAMM|nr:alpha/beta fold hydrolase [Haliea sp. SAOS-164]TGD75111.1 alpha/beta fold hydrolase [Haliea sp. SAOS-164]